MKHLNTRKISTCDPRYLNIQAMDADCNAILKEICNTDAMLELYEFFQEHATSANIVTESLGRSNGYLTWALSSASDLGIDPEKVKRMANNYESYFYKMQHMTNIITCNITEIYEIETCFAVDDWLSSIQTELESYLPTIMRTLRKE